MGLAQAVDVFATGLIAGILAMGTFAVLPAAAKLDARAHVLVRKRLIDRLAMFMPPLMFLPVPASAIGLTQCRAPVSLLFGGISLALSLATIAITVVVNAPLSRRLALWTPDPLPSNWRRDPGRWDAGHAMRMATAVGAFACAILAVG